MRMTTTHLERRLRGLIASALFAAVLGGCGEIPHSGASPLAAPPPGAVRLETMLAEMKPRNALQQTVKTGLTDIRAGRYAEAGAAFQKGLRLDPGNGDLHFLNALSYHLRGRSGDAKMLEMARTGYLTALKFEESHYMSAYFLGLIYFREKDFAQAQNYFSYALLYAPGEPALLQALAAASYYSHDTQTALWASRRAHALAPDDARSIRSLMFSEAASGSFAEMPRLMHSYQAVARAGTAGGDIWLDSRLSRADARIGDWKRYYVAAAADGTVFGTPPSDIVTYGGDSGDDAEQPELEPPPPIAAPSMPVAAAPTAAAARAEAPRPKMALIDVVIIRTEEARSQSRGVNLLDGLKTTLSGTLFGYSYSKSGGTSGRTQTITRSFAPTFSLGSIEYNLNIFNDETGRAEILARPSLLATEDATSQFFSGGVLHVQLSSNNYDGGLEDVNIGITLNVTPKFLDDDTLRVQVQADHEFLETQSEGVGFSAFAQTTKTAVQATAVLKFGETLILSGLSERGRDSGRSGVPVLQDIPGVQYLFSQKAESETKKSILVLLTPRKPQHAEDGLTQSDIDRHLDLERVYTDRLKTVEKIRNTNLNAVLAGLGNDSQYYRQFRTGDIELRFFEDEDSLYSALMRSLSILYY